MPLAIGIGIGLVYDLLVSGDAPVPPESGFLLLENDDTFELETGTGELLLEGSP